VAKKCLVEKQKKAPKFKVRAYNRCHRCGRSRAYMRDFGLCRICFRELALNGLVGLQMSWCSSRRADRRCLSIRNERERTEGLPRVASRIER
jgi:small subunit ribosomal protein S14